MARKAIPEATQKAILTRSRRRCCLCFWLQGRDEVQKGQIAHLDQDSENADEENLAFLCFDHHDEYDGVPRLAKGLREDEVRHWREELYREMAYRFRSFKNTGFALTVDRFIWANRGNKMSASFRLKNTGEVAARSPTVSIRLPDNVEGERPRKLMQMPFGRPFEMNNFEPWAMTETREDLFEPNGRVAVKELGGMNPILMPGHSWEFGGLGIPLRYFPPGSVLQLDYRVDAENGTPFYGSLTAHLPTSAQEFIVADE